MMIECVCRRVSADVSTTWPAPGNRMSRSPAPRIASACQHRHPARGQQRDRARRALPPVRPRPDQIPGPPGRRPQVRRRQPQAGIAVHLRQILATLRHRRRHDRVQPNAPEQAVQPRRRLRQRAAGDAIRGEHIARARLVGDAGNRVVPCRQRVPAGIQHAREGARIPPPAKAGDRVWVRPGESAAGIGIRVGISSTAQRPPERRPTRRDQHRAAGSDQGNTHDGALARAAKRTVRHAASAQGCEADRSG